ncbi:MAG: hypothetical protein ACREO3_04705 [Arenimonas sp.]
MQAVAPTAPARPDPATADTAVLRALVVELFERHRQRPGTPFVESDFLAHLLAAPGPGRALRDSFAGLRRMHAFLDAAQLEFAVCYSIKDRERDYTLDGFVQRTTQLMATRKASLASLRNQDERGFGGQALVVANVLLFPLVAVAHRDPVALGVVVVLVVAVNAGFGWLYLRYRRYQAALRRRLQLQT